MKHARLAALPIALAIFAATLLMAQVVTVPPISGNFALITTGFELVTPSGSTSLHLDISGEGLLTADGNGNLAGSETFTATNPAVPENGPVSAQCGGTLAGTVKEPGDGTAQIQVQFAPSSPPSPASGAQTACTSMTITLSCVEVIPNSYLPFLASPPLGPGAAGCPDPTPVPHHKHRHGHRHNHQSLIVDGGYYGPGANRLKCVATGVTSGSTAVSIDGAALSLSLQQTAPATVTLPTPQPQPSPGPCSDPSQSNCGGICTDLTSDPNNCGGCGNACAPGQKCLLSNCVGPACGSPLQTSCNGVCTYTSSDNFNCGGCGVVCDSGSTCASGACVPGTQCANGGANCNGSCTDLTADSNNCGACGVACGNATICALGICVPVKTSP